MTVQTLQLIVIGLQARYSDSLTKPTSELVGRASAEYLKRLKRDPTFNTRQVHRNTAAALKAVLELEGQEASVDSAIRTLAAAAVSEYLDL